MTSASLRANGWHERAMCGFAIGVAVCLAYWAIGGVPRDFWFDHRGTDELVRSKFWLWPTAVLDVVFRESPHAVAAIALYSLNGLTYAAVSLSLHLLRRHWVLYALVSMALVGALAWFNVAILDNFSWIWLLAVCVMLGVLASRDLRSPRRPA